MTIILVVSFNYKSSPVVSYDSKHKNGWIIIFLKKHDVIVFAFARQSRGKWQKLHLRHQPITSWSISKWTNNNHILEKEAFLYLANLLIMKMPQNGPDLRSPMAKFQDLRIVHNNALITPCVQKLVGKNSGCGITGNFVWRWRHVAWSRGLTSLVTWPKVTRGHFSKCAQSMLR